MYPYLSTRHDWSVKKAIVDLPIRMKGNSKRLAGNSLSPLGGQNKYFGTASQTLLTGVKLRLRRRLLSSQVKLYLGRLALSAFGTGIKRSSGRQLISNLA